MTTHKSYPEIKPPQISEETEKEMKAFFMRTSIPRLLEEKKKQKTLGV